MRFIAKGCFFTNEGSWNRGITSDLVTQVAQCHLRPENFGFGNTFERLDKCRLCNIEDLFKAYSSHFNLKSNDNVAILNNRRRNQKLDNEDLVRSILDLRAFDHLSAFVETSVPSDLEKILRHILWFVKHDASFKMNANLVTVAESTQELTNQFNYMKEEQKKLSNFLESVANQINAYDEIEIAKIRMRLANEVEQQDPEFESLHIIKPQMLDSTFIKHEQERLENERKLRKKLNQLIYLKNLEKTYEMKDGEENKEPCPICQDQLGSEWSILSCGHLFCKRCYDRLLRSSEKKNHVRCALCREMCLNRESYLVSTLAKKEPVIPVVIPKTSGKVEPLIEYEQEFKDVNISGSCNSAKVEGVVKCIVKILRDNKLAKCVVFSEHFVILDLIISLLHENSIGYRCIKGPKGSSQKSVDTFKQDESVNVLLMLYSHGANGLNLIEATHVLLVEPTLDKSQEIQAIG